MRAKQNFWQRLLGIPGKRLTPVFPMPMIGDMKAKDRAFYDAEVGYRSVHGAMEKWREKYPQDFPESRAERGLLPSNYRLPGFAGR